MSAVPCMTRHYRPGKKQLSSADLECCKKEDTVVK